MVTHCCIIDEGLAWRYYLSQELKVVNKFIRTPNTTQIDTQ